MVDQLTHPFDPKYDIDITDLEPWEVLHALHANTTAVGLGVKHDALLPEGEARRILARLAEQKFPWLDYVHGRPMKIGFVITPKQSWVTRVDLYDRDSLVPARDVIAALRKRAPQR